MPLVSERGVILQAFPYSETSKILRFLSGGYGVRSVIAKGALRPKSRFGGLLEPFTEGQVEFFLRDGRDLHTLSGFDVTRSRQAVGRNLAAFAGASLIAEIVLRSATEEPQPVLFDAVTAELDTITRENAHPAWVALGAVWRIVAVLGYEPELRSCVVCGRGVEENESTRFDLEGGGISCVGCRPHGRLIPPSAREALEAMLAGVDESVIPGDWSLHRSLIHAFLAAHVVADRPLRSLDLFADELR